MKFSDFINKMRVARNSGLSSERMDRPWFRFTFRRDSDPDAPILVATGYSNNGFSDKTLIFYSYCGQPISYKVWNPHNGIIVDSIEMVPRKGLLVKLRERKKNEF